MKTERPLVLLPWALVVLATLIVATGQILSLHDTAAGRQLGAVDYLAALEVCLPTVTFAAVGAFIVTRRPGNRIGWLMIVIGLSFGIGSFTSDYPAIDPRTHQQLRPLSTVIAWTEAWDWTSYLIGLLLLLLLFPTGTLLSNRWKMVAWIGVGAWVVVSLLGAVARGPINNDVGDNPYGFVAVPAALIVVFAGCGLLAMAASVVSLVVRFRTASGDVRQQIKWFTSGAALAITFVIAAFATNWSNFLALFAVAGMAAMPVFMGIAITRYHLYDIDVLINRALVYGSLTLTLGSLYIGAVVLLQDVFRSLTGQSSDLTIAVVTLAVAALFNPWRRKLQSFIDQRFYRQKYDAGRTLAAFSVRLRNDVDLGQVTADIASAVQETVQPVHVSIWLR